MSRNKDEGPYWGRILFLLFTITLVTLLIPKLVIQTIPILALIATFVLAISVFQRRAPA